MKTSIAQVLYLLSLAVSTLYVISMELDITVALNLVCAHASLLLLLSMYIFGRDVALASCLVLASFLIAQSPFFYSYGLYEWIAWISVGVSILLALTILH